MYAIITNRAGRKFVRLDWADMDFDRYFRRGSLFLKQIILTNAL